MTAVSSLATSLYGVYYQGFEEGLTHKSPREKLEAEIKSLLAELRPRLEEWSKLKGVIK